MTGIVLSKTRRGILTSLSVFTRKVLESRSLKVFFPSSSLDIRSMGIFKQYTTSFYGLWADKLRGMLVEHKKNS